MSLVGYDSSGESSGAEETQDSHYTVKPPSISSVNISPDISISDPMKQSLVLTGSSLSKELTHNVPYENINKPQVGPLNPFEGSSLKRKNIITGYAEKQAFDDAMFNVQHRTFQMLGYARDPSNNLGSDGEIIGNLENAQRYRNQDLLQFKPSKNEITELRSKRLKKGKSDILEGSNAYKGPWAEYKVDKETESEEEEEEEEEEVEESEDVKDIKVQQPSNATSTASTAAKTHTETSKFHGSSLHDYLGRTYMHVPQDLDVNLRKTPGDQESFIPKKKIYSWEGHSQGVTALRFFPNSGHLLLSSGNDSKVKLWDCYHNRELLRSFSGHSRSVKDICFTNDGTKFLSCSYDKTIKLWDTETGQCISRYSTGAIPNCVKFNPIPDRQSQFLVGTSDKKIVQFDTNTREIVQEYDHHLGAVNTVTFIDENQRFMTTSDDKTVRIWDWQVNVPIKFIADPQQHSMPSVKLHPHGKFVAAQSMDNRIVVFGATDRFRPNRKKTFTGYNCAGYAIAIDFSPDGRYIMSGDTGGNAVFWDWKTCSLKSKFKAHEGPLLCIAAHPQETSKVATAGLDGRINYWD